MPFNRLNHSILGEIRPRFALKVNLEPQETLNYLKQEIKKDASVSGLRSEHVIFLRTPDTESHYWSPEMTVRIEKEEFTDYTTVSCLIGPRQTVWAMFAFIYAAIALLTIFGGIFGIVQYRQEGQSPWIWLIPFGLTALATVFVAAKFGQKKGRNQMLHLISFLYHSLDRVCTVERLERR